MLSAVGVCLNVASAVADQEPCPFVKASTRLSEPLYEKDVARGIVTQPCESVIEPS